MAGRSQYSPMQGYLMPEGFQGSDQGIDSMNLISNIATNVLPRVPRLEEAGTNTESSRQLLSQEFEADGKFNIRGITGGVGPATGSMSTWGHPIRYVRIICTLSIREIWEIMCAGCLICQ